MPKTRAQARRAQLHRALIESDLLDVNVSLAGDVEVVESPPGTLHAVSCSTVTRIRGTSAPTQHVTAGHILTADTLGECCDYLLVDHYALDAGVRELLDLRTLIGTADRARVKSSMPKTVPDTIRKLDNKIAELQRLSHKPALREHYRATLGDAERVLDLLREAHRTNDTTRAALLRDVRKELLGRQRHLADALDDADHLIGIHPRISGSGLAASAVMALEVKHAGPGQVLRAPRYVADYLIANMFRTHPGKSHPVVVSAPLGDANDVATEVAAGLWAARQEGPLVNMATALATARTVTEP